MRVCSGRCDPFHGSICLPCANTCGPNYRGFVIAWCLVSLFLEIAWARSALHVRPLGFYKTTVTAGSEQRAGGGVVSLILSEVLWGAEGSVWV